MNIKKYGWKLPKDETVKSIIQLKTSPSSAYAELGLSMF